jgi:hypothetical protein
MATRRTVVGFVLAVMLVGAAGGCSGGDGGDDTTPATGASGLSQPEYVQRANAICEEFASWTSAMPAPDEAADYPELLRDTIAYVDDVQKRHRALAPPPADRARLEREFLAPGDEQVAVLRAGLPTVEQVASTDDKAATEAAFNAVLERFSDVAAAHQEFWVSYGLTSCV